MQESQSNLLASPREWSIAQLAVELGFSSADSLHAALNRIEKHGYKPFVLPLGRKRRVIMAPRDWLKRVQRSAYEKVLLRLPTSDRIFNRPGRGVIENAKQHIGNPYLAIFDVADCFPSTSLHHVTGAFRAAGLSEQTGAALARLTTHRGCVPHGPPTSPAVLDIVFYPIDLKMEKLAGERGAVYTRYMDDLAFSGPRSLHSLRPHVDRVLRDHMYRLNRSKVREWGPADRHTVTKIVVTATSLDVSPEYVNTVTHVLLQMESGHFPLSRSQLEGKIEWISALNPEAGRVLRARLTHIQGW